LKPASVPAGGKDLIYLMEPVYLENDLLSIAVSPLGAELQKLQRKDLSLDYLWSGDPAFWGKFSPVLFPIVGTLRRNQYTYRGTDYTLPRHGFARERTFQLLRQSPSELIFELQDDERTRMVYPFRFILQIRYTLEGRKLTVTYSLSNPDEQPLYFSLGAHPAFAIPLTSDTVYDDYALRFNRPETAVRWSLQDGLLLNQGEPLLNGSSEIPLHPALFELDAIVLKDILSDEIRLLSDRHSHGLTFGFKGWPHLGIWAAKGASFVCIEPWQGHADPVDHDGDLTRKPGIVKLEPMEQWERSWWVELF
jgi:galactose mutarotase-like enzyme